METLAKAGTLTIIGVYPPTVEAFPIGPAMNKKLSIRVGNGNHRKYVPPLIGLFRAGVVDPVALLTQEHGLSDAITAYETFGARQPSWLKIVLEPAV